jgi:hypothetical protein
VLGDEKPSKTINIHIIYILYPIHIYIQYITRSIDTRFIKLPCHAGDPMLGYIGYEQFLPGIDELP